MSIFLLLLSTNAIASPELVSTRTLDSANAEFLEGNYEEAASQYQQLIDDGNVNSDLFYNLGNSLYKDERLGEAIASWRVAQWLQPRDGDISANLEMARGHTRDRIAISPHNPALFWRSSLSPYEQIWLSAIGVGLLGLGFLFLSRRRREGQDLPFSQVLPSVAIGVPSLILGLSGATQILDLDKKPSGVVVVEEVSVRSSGASGVVLYELHDGAELEILERSNGYMLVNITGLGSGWVPEVAVFEVDPRG